MPTSTFCRLVHYSRSLSTTATTPLLLRRIRRCHYHHRRNCTTIHRLVKVPSDSSSVAITSPNPQVIPITSTQYHCSSDSFPSVTATTAAVTPTTIGVSSPLRYRSPVLVHTMTTESKDTTPHLDTVRPLQALYQRLSSIQEISEVIHDPRGNELIKSALALMNQVTLEEIGLNMDYLADLTYGQSMTIVETPSFDIAAFILPRGFTLPLHDHPHMIVCSKLLAGQVRIRSFSGLAVNDHGDVKAHLEIDTNKSKSDSAWMLTPSEGNYHEICPLADCVMLDILLPPYHDHDRPCKFYHAKKLEDMLSYVLRPLPLQYMQRVRLPHNVPYLGYRPSETS